MKKPAKKQKRRTVLLTEDELLLVSGALGLYQQAMEKAVHLSHAFTTQRQRSQMLDEGIDAVQLRARIHKQWEGNE